MLTFFKQFSVKLYHSVLSLCYPPLCLHCKKQREIADHPFCDSCLQELILLENDERCRYCFKTSPTPICSTCFEHKPFYTTLAAFDYNGVAKTLVQALKYQNKPHLAEACGAYMAAQFLRMELPLPDLIIPTPISFIRKISRGYNQSLLLAESLGKHLNRPVTDILKRKSGGHNQAGRSKQQRESLDGSLFGLKRQTNLEGKSVLLIDDVLTTGTTLKRSAEVLLEAFPEKITVMTLCIRDKG